MTEQPIPDRVARELRFLKIFAVCTTLILAGLLLAAFVPGTARFEVIEAERINIVSPDGGLALAIAGRGRLPGPTFEGHEYPQELSGGRTTASGMIFFNERGDEVGGLTYHGQLEGDSSYRASGGITFDQFRQDQVVSLQYSDNGEHRSAGLHVWDRSTEIGIAEILEVVDARSRATGAELDSLNQIIHGWREAGLAASRVFLGSRDRTATLVLRDPQSRPRIRLYVDSTGAARLAFLDSTGTVVESLPN